MTVVYVNGEFLPKEEAKYPYLTMDFCMVMECLRA